MKRAATRDFTDRILCASRSSIEMVETANGGWGYRVGTWHGRYFPGESFGGAAMVKIVDWTRGGAGTSPTTLMTLTWGDRKFVRRWPHSFTDIKLAQLAREFCEAAQAGQVGAP